MCKLKSEGGRCHGYYRTRLHLAQQEQKHLDIDTHQLTQKQVEQHRRAVQKNRERLDYWKRATLQNMIDKGITPPGKSEKSWDNHVNQAREMVSLAFEYDRVSEVLPQVKRSGHYLRQRVDNASTPPPDHLSYTKDAILNETNTIHDFFSQNTTHPFSMDEVHRFVRSKPLTKKQIDSLVLIAQVSRKDQTLSREDWEWRVFQFKNQLVEDNKQYQKRQREFESMCAEDSHFRQEAIRHFARIKPGPYLNVVDATPGARAELETTKKCFPAHWYNTAYSPLKIRVVNKTARGHYAYRKNTSGQITSQEITAQSPHTRTGVSVMAHEFTHLCEHHNENVQRIERAYLKSRLNEGSCDTWLGPGFGRKEHGYPHVFPNRYTGKINGASIDTTESFEILSMSFEHLIGNGVKQVDDDTVDFAYGTLLTV